MLRRPVPAGPWSSWLGPSDDAAVVRSLLGALRASGHRGIQWAGDRRRQCSALRTPRQDRDRSRPRDRAPSPRGGPTAFGAPKAATRALAPSRGAGVGPPPRWARCSVDGGITPQLSEDSPRGVSSPPAPARRGQFIPPTFSRVSCALLSATAATSPRPRGPRGR